MATVIELKGRKGDVESIKIKHFANIASASIYCMEHKDLDDKYWTNCITVHDGWEREIKFLKPKQYREM
jgi:hypothetical protein